MKLTYGALDCDAGCEISCLPVFIHPMEDAVEGLFFKMVWNRKLAHELLVHAIQHIDRSNIEKLDLASTV